MKLTDCYLEEDLFLKIFADYEEQQTLSRIKITSAI
jgi:hypothetical protein